MAVMAFEGVVEQGLVKLIDDAQLPNNTRVVVVVSDAQAKGVSRITSPRLVHPAQAKDFEMEMFEEQVLTPKA